MKLNKTGFFGNLLRWNLISFRKGIRFYPMFLFLGLRIRISEDYTKIYIRIPLRWYISNNTGVMFGGAMCVASDPFPALLFQKIFPNVVAWTKSHKLDYLLPAKSAVEMNLQITADDVEYMKKSLAETSKAEKEFQYYFTDKKGRKVARVTSVAYLKYVKNAL